MTSLLQAIKSVLFFSTTQSDPTEEPRISDIDSRLRVIQTLAHNDAVVAFYKKEYNPYTDVFGNFFESPVMVQGIKYRCKEGAFQAQKFLNDDVKKQFCDLDGDQARHKAAELKSRGFQQDLDWISGGKNIEAMKLVLEAGFSHGSDAAKALVNTSNAYLVEHCPEKGRDPFWTDNSDGTGQNMLGILLMQQREKLGGSGVPLPLPANFAATAAAQFAKYRQHPQSSNICQYPGCTKTVWINPTTKTPSLACGKTHLRELGRRISSSQLSGHQNYSPLDRKIGDIANPTLCQYPGCTKPAWIDPATRTPSLACGKTHFSLLTKF